MRVLVTKSNKDQSPCVQLPECVAFFNDKVVDDVIVGNTYDVMIVGYSNKLNKHTGKPSAVFLNLVQEGDILVNAPILECSGSMCSTSTYHTQYGSIYPGFRTPVPEVDNVNNHFNEIPCYPTPVIPMWIRKNKRGAYSAIGVDSYEHIHPVFVGNHAGIQRVNRVKEHLQKVREQFAGKDREFTVDGLHMWEAIRHARIVDLGITNRGGRITFASEE